MSSLIRRHRRILATCAVATSLLAGFAGCASPYGENTLWGGYRSEQLDASHWRVQYDGNGHTPREQVWAYWIYRCAEVTRQNGYTYFALLPANWTPLPIPAQPAASAAPAAWRAAPRDAWSTRPAVWTPDGSARFVQARSGGSAPTYIYVPGATITSWHTKGVVAMFNAPVAPVSSDAAIVMTAQSVLDDLGPYVQGQVPHPLDRDTVVAHGLRWVSENGAVLPLMAPPVAPALAPLGPTSYAPRAGLSVGRRGLAS